MQRVKATAREVGAVTARVKSLVPLVGWLTPQAASSRARVVVVRITAAIGRPGCARGGRPRTAGRRLVTIEICFMTAIDTPTGVTSSLPPMIDGCHVLREILEVTASAAW